MNRRLFLIGFMGCGKSSVAKALARELGVPGFDTDEMLEARHGGSIAQIFARHGEEQFREFERDLLRSLAIPEPGIVATGGGLYLDAGARRTIRECGVAVWLDVSFAEAARRLGRGPERPLWTPQAPIALRARFEGRRATYALADVAVDADDAGAQQVATNVLHSIASCRRLRV